MIELHESARCSTCVQAYECRAGVAGVCGACFSVTFCVELNFAPRPVTACPNILQVCTGAGCVCPSRRGLPFAPCEVVNTAMGFIDFVLCRRAAPAGPTHQDSFGFWMGAIFTVNYIMGCGFLGVPQGFVEGVRVVSSMVFTPRLSCFFMVGHQR